jgi:DNA-binding Lrp family transcriptional regulator
MFRLRLVELPMPTGSKDTQVLLEWLIDSLSLVRRKSESWNITDEPSALHRMFTGSLLIDPLRGWNTKELGDSCGLSQTAMHNQMLRLRESGLVSSELKGRWHIHVLRGGSMATAVELLGVQARKILDIRLAELSNLIVYSDERMLTEAEDEERKFKIKIAEPSATIEGKDRVDSLVEDLGLNGERGKLDDDLAKKITIELAQSHRAITLLVLAERLGETRSRVQRVLERLLEMSIVERVAMPDRIAQDVYLGLMRQFDARGQEWLVTRGGLGRLEPRITKKIISGIKKKDLSIEKIQKILEDVEIENQKLLLNTLGGRMPYGFRIAGKDGDQVRERVLNRLDRTIRRLITVANRIDDSLQ